MTDRPNSTVPDPDDRLVLEPDCRRCPGMAESREEIAWGVGPHDASILAIGEAPAGGAPDAERWRGGNLTGMAYTTRHSGWRIRHLLARAGFDDDAFYTNAVKCRPADDEGETREPTPGERATCSVHLERELEIVDPAVVVPTGKHATAAVFALDGRDLDGFLDTVLEIHRLDAVDAPVVPLLHPSYRDVWAPRLGYEDDDAYAAAVRESLQGAVDDGE